MSHLVITIDGPSGSGKSSVARLLSHKIGAVFLDTGSMYRAATLAAMRASVPLTESDLVGKVIDSTDFTFETGSGCLRVLIDDFDVSREIRSELVTSNVRHIASVPLLRGRLVKMQRDFARHHERIVSEGRDQGTVVFPDAAHKFFLTAELSERVKRRAAELIDSGVEVDLQKLRCRMASRDESDSTRPVGPLVPAGDAVVIDTTNLTLDGVVNKILRDIDV